MAEWTVDEFISERVEGVSNVAVKNAVSLFEEKCCLPFIARYRTHRIENMSVDNLRTVYEAYLEAKNVSEQIDKTVKSICASGGGDEFSILQLKQCKSIEEVREIKSTLGLNKSRSPALRAISAGLLPAAELLLKENRTLVAKQFLCDSYPNEASIVDGVKEIIKHILWSNVDIRQWADTVVRRDMNRVVVTVKATANAVRQSKKPSTSSAKAKKGSEKMDAKTIAKFQTYFNFISSLGFLQSHQILAINRGVKLKALRRRFKEPEHWEDQFMRQVVRCFPAAQRNCLLSETFTLCYRKKVRSYILDRMWLWKTKDAQHCAIDCFVSNLRSILSAPPLKDHVIMGIDPGYDHGCKYAIISPEGAVMSTGVFFPNRKSADADLALSDLIKKHCCDVLAIGNGSGSHTAEEYVKQLIRNGAFKPLNVQYRVVDESGSSQYSISKVAERDLPGLKPIYRSAVSIARRMLDPLSEYIKMAPESVGLGLYQHDMPKTAMKRAFESVVEECVSFSGVDLNTCSADLLARVSGLNKKLAESIVHHRSETGRFVCREQLKSVKNVGPHAFKMCSGFVRIYRQSADAKSRVSAGGPRKPSTPKWSPNPLDATSIHPENYALVDKLVSRIQLSTVNLFDNQNRKKFVDWMARRKNWETLIRSEGAPDDTVNQIIDGVRHYCEKNSRGVNQLQSLSNGIESVEDLRTGMSLRGVVMNVVTFGAFVDVGVGRQGLLHNRSLPSGVKLKAGAEVNVRVAGLDIGNGRIDLAFVSFANS